MSCASACCLLTLVGLCGWGGGGGVFCCPPVRESLMYVVVFVFPGGSVELSAHTPDHTFYVSFPSGQQGFARPLSQCLSPGFLYFLLCLFVHQCQCMLIAHFGRPVQSGVFCCPPARGSLVFVVHLCFP